MGFFWTKYIMLELKKSIEEFCVMKLNIDATFEGKPTCAFQNDMRNLASKFSTEHLQKSKSWDFDGILLPKVENLWA